MCVILYLFQRRMGGLVLDAAVNVFNGFVVFQPIINGIGGNLVSVQASKISTMLHQSSIIGIVPPHASICESPWRALVKGGKPNESSYTISMIFNTNFLYRFQFHTPKQLEFWFWCRFLVKFCSFTWLITFICQHQRLVCHSFFRTCPWVCYRYELLLNFCKLWRINQTAINFEFFNFRFVLFSISRTSWSTWCGNIKSIPTIRLSRIWRH